MNPFLAPTTSHYIGELADPLNAHNMQTIGVPPLGLHIPGGVSMLTETGLPDSHVGKLLSLSSSAGSNLGAIGMCVSSDPTNGVVDDLQAKKTYLKSHRLLPLVFKALDDCKKEGVFGNMQTPAAFLQQEPGSIDFSLDEFLTSQGLDSAASSPSSPESPTASCPSSVPTMAETFEFSTKLDALRKQYEDELEKINKVCNEFCSKMMSVLREQSSFRPVSQDEIRLKLAGVRHRFDGLKLQLKQGVCNTILSLQKEYHQSKKRRALSKKANEVLNIWFNEHIKDPYPNEEEKSKLASQCMLTINQINNWFGNKRIRYKRKCWEEHRKKGTGEGTSPMMEQPKPSGSDPDVCGSSQPVLMMQ